METPKRVKIELNRCCFVDHLGNPHFTTYDVMIENENKSLILPWIHVGRHFGLPKDLIRMIAEQFLRTFVVCPVLDFINESLSYLPKRYPGPERIRKLYHAIVIHGFHVDPEVFFKFYKTFFLEDDADRFIDKFYTLVQMDDNANTILFTRKRGVCYVFQFYKRRAPDEIISEDVDAQFNLDTELFE
jgi:hypothetical protein